MKLNPGISEDGGDGPLNMLETGNLMAEYNHMDTGSNVDKHRSSLSPSTLLSRSHRVYQLMILVLTTSLICCFAIILCQQRKYAGDAQNYYYYSPALEATKPGSRVTQFNETRWSPYDPESGYSFEHINGNWTNILRVGMMSLSEEELTQTGASPVSAVKFPPESGGGYMSYLASHHHLHCLYLLHQSLHPDYYSTRSTLWLDVPDPKKRLSHFDHCIEALRQYVTCNADTTVVTHQWFEEYPLPVPVQGNPRKCVDWDAHWQWQQDRQVPAPKEPISKPSDVILQPLAPAVPPPGSLNSYINVKKP